MGDTNININLEINARIDRHFFFRMANLNKVLLMAIFAVLISLFLAQSSELRKSKKRTGLKNLTFGGKRAKSSYSRQKGQGPSKLHVAKKEKLKKLDPNYLQNLENQTLIKAAVKQIQLHSSTAPQL